MCNHSQYASSEHYLGVRFHICCFCVRVRVLLLHQILILVNITCYLAIACCMFLFVIKKIDCYNFIVLVHLRCPLPHSKLSGCVIHSVKYRLYFSDCKHCEGCILRRDKTPWFSVFIKPGFLFSARDRNIGSMDLHQTWPLVILAKITLRNAHF